MGYNVRIVLIIRSIDDKKWSGGYVDITLPFVPFEGLEVNGDRWTTKPIKSISYNIKDQSFHCITEDKEFETDDFDFVDMDFLIKEAKKTGWQGFEEIYENAS